MIKRAVPKVVIPDRILTPKERKELNREIIRNAQKDGVVANYRWLARMVVPPGEHRLGPQDNGDNRVACWPLDMMPVIRLEDDINGEYVELMVDFFMVANRGCFFYPALTTVTLLDIDRPGKWYHWGELMVDKLCPECGQIYTVNAIEDLPVCDCRDYRVDRPRPGGRLAQVTRAYIDGVIYERRIK